MTSRSLQGLLLRQVPFERYPACPVRLPIAATLDRLFADTARLKVDLSAAVGPPWSLLERICVTSPKGAAFRQMQMCTIIAAE